MAANPKQLDLGPLSWVKTEIDHSLSQARENLDKLAAAPADRAPVKYTLTHLHQATGALGGRRGQLVEVLARLAERVVDLGLDPAEGSEVDLVGVGGHGGLHRRPFRAARPLSRA